MATPVKSPALKRMKADDAAGLEVEMEEEEESAPTAPPATDPPSVTLEAISKLLDDEFDQRLSPLKGAIEKLSTDLGIFKTKMKDELQAMGLKLKSVESQASEAADKVSVLEKELQNFKRDAKADITNSLAALKLEPPESSDANLTVVIGNIPNASNLEQADAWVSKRCSEASVPKPVRTFLKSEVFGGVIFAKCASGSQRDALIEIIRNTPQGANPKPWANIDQPINVRTAESVLFAFKFMLVDWGFGKQSVWWTRTIALSKWRGKK